jgi:hypothetical protein
MPKDFQSKDSGCAAMPIAKTVAMAKGETRLVAVKGVTPVWLINSRTSGWIVAP